MGSMKTTAEHRKAYREFLGKNFVERPPGSLAEFWADLLDDVDELIRENNNLIVMIEAVTGQEQ